MVLRGAGRDLVTDRDGLAKVTDRAEVLVTIDDRERPMIDRLEVDGRPGPAELIGGPARSGFRRSLGSAKGVGAAGSLRFGLLDDIPGAVIISGYLVAVGIAPPRPASAWLKRADVCSGWHSDGTMMAGVRSSGAIPRIDAPAAPELRSGDDLAWHEASRLQPGEMRRARRMDVLERDGSMIVDAMFRDHYVDRDGEPAIVHEYQLSARLDATGRVTELRADPHVLPWPECPIAVSSAERVVGRIVGDLRGTVSGAFTGTSTCTHLNDLIRTLDDVPILVGILRSGLSVGLEAHPPAD